MNIEEVIENLNTYTLDDFFHLWEGQKDVFIIKYDGLRENNKFTVLLLAHENRFETISIECDEILCGIEDVLIRYKDASTPNNQIDN